MVLTPTPADSQDTAVGALITQSNADSMAAVRSSSFFWSIAGGTKILRTLACSSAAISSAVPAYLQETTPPGRSRKNAPHISNGAYCAERCPPDLPLRQQMPMSGDDPSAAKVFFHCACSRGSGVRNTFSLGNASSVLRSQRGKEPIRVTL